MYINIVFLPLFSFLALILAGRFIGRRGSTLVSISCVGYAWFLGLFALSRSMRLGEICVVEFSSWIDSGMLLIPLEFLFDALTTAMLFLVLSVSLVVHVYSVEYMRQDPHLQRFLAYLSLFTFFMVLLLTSNNFVQLFLGWEGVGLCSYLLISFWYTRLDACKSAIKAVLFNKIGDCSLLLGMSLMFYVAQSLNFQVVFCVLPLFQANVVDFGVLSCSLVDVVALALLVAAMGKSAQFFLHPWLADAMEGPTPVSALIHAATMVTAGIYLIIRCSYLLEYSNVAVFMGIIGSLTIFFASTSAFFQYDLKKIIAYSTCSQLGYMFTACAFSGYKVALFHLFNHGFFKALLFLSAGLLIHNFMEEQDIRKMGGLRTPFPVTYAFFFVGSAALMGVPFLSGYYSKDFIIELLYITNSYSSFICFHVSLFSAALTAMYSVRLLYLAFLCEPNGFRSYYKAIGGSEAEPVTIGVLFCLALASIFIGFLGKDLFIGMGSDFLSFAVFEGLVRSPLFFYAEFLVPYPVKAFPLLFVCLGVLLYATIVRYNRLFAVLVMTDLRVNRLFVFFNQAWFVNYVYYVLGNSLLRGFLTIFYLDKIVLEEKGPLLAQKSVSTLASMTNTLTFKLVSFQKYYLVLLLCFVLCSVVLLP